MQRQAVRLLITEPPMVATGLEKAVAMNSGMVVRAERTGIVSFVDDERIKVDERESVLRKFTGLNEHTCLNQKPGVHVGDKVKAGQLVAHRAGTHHTES